MYGWSEGDEVSGKTSTGTGFAAGFSSSTRGGGGKGGDSCAIMSVSVGLGGVNCVITGGSGHGGVVSFCMFVGGSSFVGDRSEGDGEDSCIVGSDGRGGKAMSYSSGGSGLGGVISRSSSASSLGGSGLGGACSKTSSSNVSSREERGGGRGETSSVEGGCGRGGGISHASGPTPSSYASRGSGGLGGGTSSITGGVAGVILSAAGGTGRGGGISYTGEQTFGITLS